MEKVNKVYGGNFDEVLGHLVEIYGSAQWALRYGATKEDLLWQIEEACEMHQDCLLEDDWLIRPNNWH